MVNSIKNTFKGILRFPRLDTVLMVEEYIKEQFHKNVEASKWQNQLEQEQESSDYR